MSEFQSIDTLDPSQLVQYDWPGSLNKQIWRHITDASLTDSDENYRSMLFSPGTKTFFLRGRLVPSPNSSRTLSIFLKIPVSNYSIDVVQETRGLWMQSDIATYYKIDTFSSEYSKSFGCILDTVLKFLELHDKLIDCAKYRSNVYQLDNTILSIRKKYGVKIDLGFILNNKQMIEDNLKSFISKPKSPKLYSTIKSLTAKQVERSKLNETMSDGSSEEDDDEEVIAAKLKRKRALSGKKRQQTEDSNSLDSSTHEISISSSSSDRKKDGTSPPQPETLMAVTTVPTASAFLGSNTLDEESPASHRIIEKSMALDAMIVVPAPSHSAVDSNQRRSNDIFRQNTSTNKENPPCQSNSHSDDRDDSNTHYRSNNNSSATSTQSTAQLERLVISKPIPKKSSVLDTISSSEPTVDSNRVNKVARTTTTTSDQFSSRIKLTGLTGSSLSQRTAFSPRGMDGPPPSSMDIATVKDTPASALLRKDDAKTGNHSAAHVSTTQSEKNNSDAGGTRTVDGTVSDRNRTVSSTSSKDAMLGIDHFPRAALPHFTINRKPEIVDARAQRRSEDSDLGMEYRGERDSAPHPKKILANSRPSLADKAELPRSSSANPSSTSAPSHASNSGIGRGREAVRPAWMEHDKRKKEVVPTLSRPKYSSAAGISSPRSGNSSQSSSSSNIGRMKNTDDIKENNYSVPSQTTIRNDIGRDNSTSSSSNDLKRKRDALNDSEGPLRPSSEQSGPMHTKMDPRIAVRDRRRGLKDMAESLRSSSTTEHRTKVVEAAKVPTQLRQPILIRCPFCKSEKLGCKCRESRKVWLPLPQSRWRSNTAAGENERWHVSPFLSTSHVSINVFDDLIPSITSIDLTTHVSSAIGTDGGGDSSSCNGPIVHKSSKYRNGEGFAKLKDQTELDRIFVGPEFELAKANKLANAKITGITIMGPHNLKKKSLVWRDVHAVFSYKGIKDVKEFSSS